MFIVPVPRRNKNNNNSRSQTPTISRLGATNDELKALGERHGWQVRPLSANDLHVMSADELLWHEQFNAPNLKAAAEQGTAKARNEKAEQQGWTARELTYRDIEKMSADEAAWHQRFNSENWRLAFEREEDRRASKQHVAKTRVELMWAGNFTDEEDHLAREAGDTFARQHPQFERTLESAQKMAKHMQERNYDATKTESYARAFRELLEAGQITPLKLESADEFYANHAELHLQTIPPMIAARNARAASTARHFEKTKTATARAGSTTVVAYEIEQSGYPPTPTRYSFRKLLDSLSADEYQRRLNEDPAFASAIDKLK